MRLEVPFEDWVVAVFDPTVEDPWPPPVQDLAHLTQLFADPVGVLEGLSDEEIGVGLWSVLDSGGAGTALALNDPTLPLDAFEDAVLDVLEDVLAIEHAACQESPIHGLGHRIGRHPERAPAILDRWLAAGRERDPRLRTYAAAARTGCIQ
jgi:hypothetical protein